MLMFRLIMIVLPETIERHDVPSLSEFSDLLDGLMRLDVIRVPLFLRTATVA